MYNKELLIRQTLKGEKIKYILFWGHTPKVKGETDKSCFSQWFPSPFTVDGHTYATAEHWMMAGKARLFKDQAILEQILGSSHPDEAKKLGRQVANFNQLTWESHCMELVITGNIHKFEQNPALKEFLLNTGDRVIVEASPRDTIWGIGYGPENPKSTQPENWRGENKLGFALMAVRDHLRN